MRFTPDNWYALCTLSAKGGWIKVRKLVSGRLMAQYEKRDGERIVPVVIISRSEASIRGHTTKRAAGKSTQP